MTGFLHSACHSCTEGSYGKSMPVVDPLSVHELVEAVIVGFSMLGGVMACLSGSYAARSLAAGEPSDTLAQRVNEGIARGFTASRPASVVAALIMLVT